MENAKFPRFRQVGFKKHLFSPNWFCSISLNHYADKLKGAWHFVLGQAFFGRPAFWEFKLSHFFEYENHSKRPLTLKSLSKSRSRSWVSSPSLRFEPTQICKIFKQLHPYQLTQEFDFDNSLLRLKRNFHGRDDFRGFFVKKITVFRPILVFFFFVFFCLQKAFENLLYCLNLPYNFSSLVLQHLNSACKQRCMVFFGHSGYIYY